MRTLCFLERAGCAGGGKGILCSEEKTFTLSTVDNMRVCMQEVWSVDPIASNSMKSNNPNSGFHKSKVIKTLDTSVPDPSKNQGGHIIMEEKAMAFAQNTRDEVRYQNGDGQIVGALAASPGMKQTTYLSIVELCSSGQESLVPWEQQGHRIQGVSGVSPTLTCNPAGGMKLDPVLHHTVVRRLTPVECERLQGFPDNYTNIPWAGKPAAPDSRRYKALGNSFAVPVVHWIGKRMLEAKQVVCDEAAIDRILYVTPSDDGQLSLF